MPVRLYHTQVQDLLQCAVSPHPEEVLAFVVKHAGCYKFDRYKTPPADGTPPQPADLPHLVTPEVTDR